MAYNQNVPGSASLPSGPISPDMPAAAITAVHRYVRSTVSAGPGCRRTPSSTIAVTASGLPQMTPGECAFTPSHVSNRPTPSDTGTAVPGVGVTSTVSADTRVRARPRSLPWLSSPRYSADSTARSSPDTKCLNARIFASSQCPTGLHANHPYTANGRASTYGTPFVASFVGFPSIVHVIGHDEAGPHLYDSHTPPSSQCGSPAGDSMTVATENRPNLCGTVWGASSSRGGAYGLVTRDLLSRPGEADYQRLSNDRPPHPDRGTGADTASYAALPSVSSSLRRRGLRLHRSHRTGRPAR